MATEMRTLSVARARVHSNSEAKRQSNWTRHLNQSKSIRLREARRRSGRGSTLERASAKGVSFSERKQQVAATLALESRQALKMLWLNLLQQKQKQQHQHHHRRQPLQQQQQQQQQRQQQQRQELNGDFGRVSINHVVDYDGQRKRAREAAGDTSGIQNPVISSEKSKSFRRNGRQKHLNSNTISSSSNNNINNNNNSDNIDSAREEMAPRGARHRFGLSSSALVVMVAASIVCCANLIGHCNCDTNGNNPFSGFHHSAASAGFETPLTGPPSAAATQSRAAKSAAAWSSRLVGSLGAARRSGPPAGAPRKSSMEELLRSMAESVERQHLGLSVRSAPASSGAAKPSKFDSSSSLDGRRPATNSQALHDDFLKDILASHDRKSQAARKSVGFKPSAHGLPPAVSQADQELRQIMLMHEHAASAGKLQPAQAHQEAAANPIADPTTATRWPSGVKLLSKLPSDLIRKASLAAVVPESVLKIGHRKKAAEAHSNPAFTTTTTGSPFTPRAHTKNYLMGPILNLGQMLMAQPKPTSASRKTSKSVGGPAHPSGEQATYSQPANELMTSESNQKPNESQPESDSGFAAADGSQTPPSPAAKGGSPAGDPSGKKPASGGGGGGRRNGWLVDGATQLAQTYFKDSFRDLLTLSQLPIFFGGPVSTAPSDIEPGGKKWLANKQAAEQMRGNQTGAVEELLRYLYILTNVGVRRKRDPLKVLGSSHGMQPNALSALANRATGHRRQLMALLADRPTTSLIKFPPPKTELGSKLSSLLKPGKDHIKSRGVMWEMATDPTLAVTMFHLLERASVALPLGFVLMPFVHMIRHPMGGLNFGRILPARASHRSVELEELVKRLDMVDKILSRSMRSTHRDASFMG